MNQDCFLSDSGAAWVQAVGTIITIIFALYTWRQQNKEAEKKLQFDQIRLKQAASLLTSDAMDRVGDRLNAALKSAAGQEISMALRGVRATEAVDALRQLGTVYLPNDIVGQYLQIRGRLSAINARLDEIFTSEVNGRSRNERSARLNSAIKIWKETCDIYVRMTELCGFEGKSNNFTADSFPLLNRYEIGDVDAD